MKKRGFGIGKWNGVGGKLHDDETIQQAAIRETGEEISVKINEEDLQNVATIDFFFENKKEFDQQVHIFFTEKWQGEPTESEEMKPQWYSYSELPFKNMWINDVHWLPKVIKGEKLKATFTFNQDGSQIIKQSIGVL